MIVQERDHKNHVNHLNGFRGLLAVSVLLQHGTKYLHLKGDYVISCDLGNEILILR